MSDDLFDAELAASEKKESELKTILFNEFWRLYPNRQAKAGASKKFMALPVDTMRLIVEHVKQRVIDDPKWRDKTFVPMPTTFLNQGRWEDEYETNVPRETKIKGSKAGTEQIMCDKCRSDTRSQRHIDICAAGVPYWDLKLDGQAVKLDPNSPTGYREVI